MLEVLEMTQTGSLDGYCGRAGVLEEEPGGDLWM